jgi:DHA2 family multidrug resistance protein
MAMRTRFARQAGASDVGDQAHQRLPTYIELFHTRCLISGGQAFFRPLGRKHLFLSCLALFAATSVLCAFACNLQSLLLFRVLQGLVLVGCVS